LFNDTPWVPTALLSEQTSVQLLRQCGASSQTEANCAPNLVGKLAADGGASSVERIAPWNTL
jgi:hypothetical protein